MDELLPLIVLANQIAAQPAKKRHVRRTAVDLIDQLAIYSRLDAVPFWAPASLAPPTLVKG